MRRLIVRTALILVMAAGPMAGQKTPASTPSQAASSTPAAEKPSFPEPSPALQALLLDKVKTEWEAVKKRDKTAFSKLLADDFIQVESDGDGARNRLKAANELAESFVVDYHLQLFKCYALAPDLTYVRYENTMEFPAKSALRYKRLWIGEIWVKQGGDWKLWRYQETPVK